MRGSIVTAAAALLVTFSVMAQNTPDAPAKATETSPTLTPVDQGNSKADLKVTAQIRKEVVAANNLSVTAQNVKIVTNGGKVTLRGPVDTADEKRRIGDIAQRYAQPGDVDNQLEVKAVAD